MSSKTLFKALFTRNPKPEKPAKEAVAEPNEYRKREAEYKKQAGGRAALDFQLFGEAFMSSKKRKEYNDK